MLYTANLATASADAIITSTAVTTSGSKIIGRHKSLDMVNSHKSLDMVNIHKAPTLTWLTFTKPVLTLPLRVGQKVQRHVEFI